jgi:hypothetical protein
MALIAKSVPVAAGTVESLAAASGGGDTFYNDGKSILVVNNGAVAPITVTIAAQHTCNQGVSHDFVATVANGVRKTFPPLRQDIYNDDNGQAHVAYSSATTITVGVISPT